MNIITGTTNQKVTAKQLSDQDQFNNFKKLFYDIAVTRKILAQKSTPLEHQKSQYINQRNALMSQFKAEAVKMYPETANKNLVFYVQGLPSNHALVLLWNQYEEKLKKIDQEIADIETMKKAIKSSELELSSRESKIVSAYAQFQYQTKSAYPAVKTLIAQVNSEASIPQAEYSNPVLSYDALNMLNPDAQAMIILQTSVTESQSSSMPMTMELDRMSAADKATSKPKSGLALAAVAGLMFILGAKD